MSPSADSRRAVVSYWRKYVHEVLVNRLGGLSLPRNSVVRLTDRPDITLDVYRGRKTTIQQQQQYYFKYVSVVHSLLPKDTLISKSSCLKPCVAAVFLSQYFTELSVRILKLKLCLVW